MYKSHKNVRMLYKAIISQITPFLNKGGKESWITE